MDFNTQDYIDLLTLQVLRLKQCAELLRMVNASDGIKQTAAMKIRAMASILDCDAKLLAMNSIAAPEIQIQAHLEQSNELIEEFESLERYTINQGHPTREPTHDRVN